ncbi:uncharacterized protein RMCC_4101 [Mycolicibacterium canariasense]|uniref:Uncharacterized protein n=1 Tax=Mycolicibacterium canariasense TaxID=228230 RepID=A0A100WFF5_MYCCR|nr:hypothetical protein [Mycolicibacterium canariasense]MCV7211536.1 hypothetical protein [Mycolicibacterium canariasense]ORV08537.1 hypothetical protein AWB94_12430 [Mycolicibacterium canariasense]GAS97135.1 uncharacterized protein RMCC_4101 [Mycolicibacterium canariasense]
MPAEFPAYTARESISRPAGLGLMLCCCSAICLAVAAVLTLTVWGSPEFAADFDGGTRTAQVSADLHLATGLLIGGVLAATGGIIWGGGHNVRAVGILLLLLGAPGVAILTLPLLDYYG